MDISEETKEETKEEENRENSGKKTGNSGRGVYSKFFMYAVIAALFAFFSGFIFVKNYALKTREYKDKISQFEALKSENDKLQHENELLQQQITYLKTKSGIESVAREKLGLIKPSEVAFVVVNDDKKKAQSQSTVGTDIPKSEKAPSEEAKSPPVNDDQAVSEGWFQKIWNNIFGR